jgi:ABC-type transport system involved in Fe-S cluster assembly fused permease/ATPase subunit
MRKKSIHFVVSSGEPDSGGWSLIGKLVTFTLGIVSLLLAFMFSVVLLAVAGVIVIILFVYFWWKTRELRQQFRAAQDSQSRDRSPDSDRVYEGESRREG